MSHAACDVLGVGPFAAAALYENLDWLAPRQAAVEEKLFAQRPKPTSVSLFLYDGTRRYVAGTHQALAAFGYQRDGQTGKRQMVLGLLCAEDGQPVSIEVFPGQTQDPQTFAVPLNQVKARFGVTASTCGGARGMSKGQPSEDLAPQGLHAITAITKPQMEKLLQQGTVQMALFALEVAEVRAEEGIRYVRRRKPGRAQEVRDTRHAKLATLQAHGAQQNPYLPDHPRAHPQGALQQLGARAAQRRLVDWVALPLEGCALTLTLEEDAQQEAAKRDGCDVLKTDLTPAQAPKAMVHDRYKELAGVEQAFRTGKTAPLAGRPLFLRLAARTRAQAFVVRLA